MAVAIGCWLLAVSSQLIVFVSHGFKRIYTDLRTRVACAGLRVDNLSTDLTDSTDSARALLVLLATMSSVNIPEVKHKRSKCASVSSVSSVDQKRSVNICVICGLSVSITMSFFSHGWTLITTDLASRCALAGLRGVHLIAHRFKRI